MFISIVCYIVICLITIFVTMGIIVLYTHCVRANTGEVGYIACIVFAYSYGIVWLAMFYVSEFRNGFQSNVEFTNAVFYLLQGVVATACATLLTIRGIIHKKRERNK